MARIDLGFSCGEDWNAMEPSEAGARRCGACGERVVDLSRLTWREAEQLVRRNDGTCVSFETDADGDVIFRREGRRTAGVLALGAAALLAACAADEPSVAIVPEPPVTEPMETAPIVTIPSTTTGAPAPRTGLDDAALGDQNDVDGSTSTAPTATAAPTTRSTPARLVHRHAGRAPRIAPIRRDRNL